MSEHNALSFAEQKKLKLKIEDEIPKFFVGEMREAAQALITHMRANKMQPTWQAINGWGVIKNGTKICSIGLKKDSWSVVPRISRWNKLVSSYNLYEQELDADQKDIVLANINHCRRCANCGPGWDMQFFGKEYKDVCHNAPVQYIDPDVTELECIKAVLELMKTTVAANKK